MSTTPPATPSAPTSTSPAPPQRKLGKLSPRRHLCKVSLGDFLDKATTWPAVRPSGLEFAVDPSAWGMLGNDQVGDCATAGILHLIQAQAANVGVKLHATTAQALALYSAVTGYNPSDPSTDQGTVLTELLAFVQKNGVELTDQTGKPITIEVVGSAALDITSVAQMRYATSVFGGSYLGIQCPQRCMDDTANWNFSAGLPPVGGHCITRVGQGSAGGKIVSWGEVIPFSNGFWMAYGDEAYAVVTKAWLNGQGTAPSGLDLDGLVAALKTL